MMPFPMYQPPAPQPTFAPPVFPQPPRPAPQVANPVYMPPANTWQPAPQQSPVLAAQAAQINQPKARAYAPEPPPPVAPRMIQLPTPTELGLAVPLSATPAALPTSPAATVDWNQTHARLRQLGAVGFHLDHLPGGVTRVTVLVPNGQTGQTRTVEAIASSDAAAIATMFERVR